MSIGLNLLIAIAILVAFGVPEKMLSRMNIRPWAAQVAIFAAIAGSIIPEFEVMNNIYISLGGALVPLTCAMILLGMNRSIKERLWGVGAALIAAACSYLLGQTLIFHVGIFSTAHLQGLLVALIAVGLCKTYKSTLFASLIGVLLGNLIPLIVDLFTGGTISLFWGVGEELDMLVVAAAFGTVLCDVHSRIRNRRRIKFLQKRKSKGKTDIQPLS